MIGTERNYCTGYVFCGEKVELQGKAENSAETVKPPMLIINEIPEERRIEDREILREAIAEGKRAEKEGRYFHPAANGKIDDCTAWIFFIDSAAGTDCKYESGRSTLKSEKRSWDLADNRKA